MRRSLASGSRAKGFPRQQSQSGSLPPAPVEVGRFTRRCTRTALVTAPFSVWHDPGSRLVQRAAMWLFPLRAAGVPFQRIRGCAIAPLWPGDAGCDGASSIYAVRAATMKCLLCDGCGWVCENHPDKPWEGEHACPCGGAGMPCRNCNMSGDDEDPRLPEGFRTDADKKGWRH